MWRILFYSRPSDKYADNLPALVSGPSRKRKGDPGMKPTEQRDLFPGALEMMILRTLKRQPLHGYALAQHIKRTRAANGIRSSEGHGKYVIGRLSGRPAGAITRKFNLCRRS